MLHVIDSVLWDKWTRGKSDRERENCSGDVLVRLVQPKLLSHLQGVSPYHRHHNQFWESKIGASSLFCSSWFSSLGVHSSRGSGERTSYLEKYHSCRSHTCKHSTNQPPPSPSPPSAVPPLFPSGSIGIFCDFFSFPKTYVHFYLQKLTCVW